MRRHRLGELRLAFSPGVQQEPRVPQQPQEPNPLQVAGAEAEVRGAMADAAKKEAEAAAVPVGVEQRNAELQLKAADLADRVTKQEEPA